MCRFPQQQEQEQEPVVARTSWSSEDTQRSGDHKKKAFQPYHSKSVPKPAVLGAGETTSSSGPITTLMLRNIPNKYTQSALLEEIGHMGFAGTYDFFYLPMDIHNHSNVGYAFINMLVPTFAERFQTVFREHRFRLHRSRKISSVSTAHVQGLDANLRHFENRAVTHARNDQYRPVVLQGAERVDFEAAVEQAKARAEEQAAAELAAEAAAAEAEARARKRAVRGQSAYQDFEARLREYLITQQAPEGQAAGLAGQLGRPAGAPGCIAPPPGLSSSMNQSAGWGRHSSAPATVLGAPASAGDAAARVLTLSSLLPAPGPAGPGPARPAARARALSVGDSPSGTPADCPAYVPLPTIPSSSKLFLEGEAADFGAWPGASADNATPRVGAAALGLPIYGYMRDALAFEL